MHCREVWQAEWDGCSANKLHSVKRHLGYCSVIHLSRRDAVIVRRLRIGHTRVSHKYLLSGDSQPLCDKCKCFLTVKHILLECCSLKHVRENYFTCSSLKELFETVDATTIMYFIKEVNFLPVRRYASAGNSDRNVSVCPSVCHAPVLCQNEES